jgi:hypothetical protein
MTSVLNIEPNNIIIKQNREDFLYDFLDFLKGSYILDISKYYDLLNSINSFKLKNVYKFTYLRIYKINKKGFNITPLSKKLENITGQEMNRYLSEYINISDGRNKLVNAIIIMNSIQLYFYPNINLS